MTNRQFILEGKITNVSKGAYSKATKRWEIQYTVEGLAGKWEVDSELNEPMTANFIAAGPRYKIGKKFLKAGKHIKIWGWQIGDECFCEHWM